MSQVYLWYSGIISVLHRRSWVSMLQFSFLIVIFLSLNSANSVKTFIENTIGRKVMPSKASHPFLSRSGGWECFSFLESLFWTVFPE